jgi:ribosomal protein S18 acetylase RimI-like enzyme
VELLGEGDLGHRVVVRHRTSLGPTDVLGELIVFDERRLVVRAETGAEVDIARTDVIAGKPVGPRPPRYSEILALERIADLAWPAPEVVALGEWRLRAASGWTNRANSALPLGTGAGSVDETVRACERFYSERGLPPKITVPLPVRRDVARHLDAAGWVAAPVVLVQTAPLAGWPAVPGLDVDLRSEPSRDFLAMVASRKRPDGGPQQQAGLPEAANHVLTAVPAVRFAQAADHGSLVAVARGAVVETWLHIGLVAVRPAARRRGYARALSAALAAWAAGSGATAAVLQVEQHNEPAVRLYQSLGFTTHHTYRTYRAP